MTDKKRSLIIVITVLFLCAVMAIVDGILKAEYFAKSLIKLALFSGAPVLYLAFDKKTNLCSVFSFDKKGIKTALFLGIAVYAVILLGYLLLKDIFDFSAITGALAGGVGVTGGNFVFVSLYISFVNSLLEEFFFRGFAFLSLRNLSSSRFAYIFSAAAFSLYHVAMMTGWFSLPLFVLVLAGLFAGGLIFNLLNAKSGTLYPSWLVHMFANFAINTVGFMLFGIIPTP